MGGRGGTRLRKCCTNAGRCFGSQTPEGSGGQSTTCCTIGPPHLLTGGQKTEGGYTWKNCRHFELRRTRCGSGGETEAQGGAGACQPPRRQSRGGWIKPKVHFPCPSSGT